LNRTVALKMILAGQLASADDVARFRAEAEAAASLDHPNIVPIHEISEHDGLHYFSMRLIEGRSLAEQVEPFTRNPRSTAHLLTGKPPFKAESVLETLHQLRTMEPIPPRCLIPTTPRDLEAICLKCLEKNSARRYGSAAELADDLERWLGGEPVRVRPVTRVE